MKLTDLPMDRIQDICRRYGVRELSIFGSAASDQMGPESDIDFLVEFDPSVEIGFMALAAMQRELSGIVNRKVDLVTKGGLKPRIRETILSSAKVLYAA